MSTATFAKSPVRISLQKISVPGNASREALALLAAAEPATSRTDAKRKTVEVVKAVAESLRNLPATCRRYYIHPAVLTSFENGTLPRSLECAGNNACEEALNEDIDGIRPKLRAIQSGAVAA